MADDYNPDQYIPTLEEPVAGESVEPAHIDIPVLHEAITQEALETLLSSSLSLPVEMQNELTERVSQMVQARLNQVLPDLMQVVQKEIIDSVHKHIAETLPEILSELTDHRPNQR